MFYTKEELQDIYINIDLKLSKVHKYERKKKENI